MVASNKVSHLCYSSTRANPLCKRLLLTNTISLHVKIFVLGTQVLSLCHRWSQWVAPGRGLLSHGLPRVAEASVGIVLAVCPDVAVAANFAASVWLGGQEYDSHLPAIGCVSARASVLWTLIGSHASTAMWGTAFVKCTHSTIRIK